MTLIVPIFKISSGLVKDLNVNSKAIMLPENTKGKYLYDLRVQDFLTGHKKALIKKEKTDK